MRRYTTLVVAALALAVPAHGLAKGGSMRLPEPKVVRAGPPIPDVELSPSQILGGCGPKRTRDPVTHKCRGPADVGN
jgi:hypothetical protein